jgi:hypothetical protein
MKTPSISHLEAVYGHGLAVLSRKFGVKRQLTLRVIPTLEAGQGHIHFDRENGVFTMSEDNFHGPMDVPVYHLARLAGVVSYEENPAVSKPHVVDCAVVAADLERYEQDLIIRSAAYAKHKSAAPRVVADNDNDGEVCTEAEAKAILDGGADIFWPRTIFLPPGTGRGSVMYQWRDGSEFMIRVESTMTTDDDGKHHFTDTEYRKLRRA